jgi:hypothetical protein
MTVEIDEWMTRPEVARYFRVSIATIKRWEKTQLPVYHVAEHTVRYKRDDVLALAKRTAPASTE